MLGAGAFCCWGSSWFSPSTAAFSRGFSPSTMVPTVGFGAFCHGGSSQFSPSTAAFSWGFSPFTTISTLGLGAFCWWGFSQFSPSTIVSILGTRGRMFHFWCGRMNQFQCGRMNCFQHDEGSWFHHSIGCQRRSPMPLPMMPALTSRPSHLPMLLSTLYAMCLLMPLVMQSPMILRIEKPTKLPTCVYMLNLTHVLMDQGRIDPQTPSSMPLLMMPNKWMSKWMQEQMKAWMSKQMTEWMKKQGMNESMNEQMKEQTHRKMKATMNESSNNWTRCYVHHTVYIYNKM